MYRGVESDANPWVEMAAATPTASAEFARNLLRVILGFLCVIVRRLVSSSHARRPLLLSKLPSSTMLVHKGSDCHGGRTRILSGHGWTRAVDCGQN